MQQIVYEYIEEFPEELAEDDGSITFAVDYPYTTHCNPTLIDNDYYINSTARLSTVHSSKGEYDYI